MKTDNDGLNREDESLLSTSEAETQEGPAWEMIAPGRYQPRRIRGSHRGRKLG
jgi:hypothetical protein